MESNCKLNESGLITLSRLPVNCHHKCIQNTEQCQTEALFKILLAPNKHNSSLCSHHPPSDYVLIHKHVCTCAHAHTHTHKHTNKN